MLLMIDNYDSFTYNLVQYLGELGEDVRVIRNDEIDLAGIADMRPDHIVVSPGPCTPNEAGVSVPLIGEFAGKIPILGVCLGHQSIGQAFGGRIVRAKEPMHGKTSLIHHLDAGVFKGLPEPSAPRAITPWSSNARRCRIASTSRPGPMMAKSWVCVTRRWRSRASSSIPSPFSPSTGTPCWRIF